ncbi:MAG: transglycosylase domain-containing protein [Gemmatimonadota bacterium]|nr:transglycosylase domain-containing protein [Gemmatimonadota bacterium]
MSFPIDPLGTPGGPDVDLSDRKDGPSRSFRRLPRTLRRALHRRGIHLVWLLGLVLIGWVTVTRTFSVSCAPEEACLTLTELEAGEPLPEAIELVGRDGSTLAEVAGPLRRSLDAEEIPELVRDAFVAVEDRRFWDHGGVDGRGVMRAAFRNLRAGEVEEGASTIPMQLVRTLWSESLRGVGPWRRKVIEALTAPRLIERLGHERVLTLYLNAIYMGNGIYGIERASQHYFGKGVDALDLGQVATLVGMTRGPERYEPRRHPERARARRNVVLGILHEEGIASTEEVEAARSEPLGTSLHLELRRHRSYLSAAATRELRAVTSELAGRSGLRIFTTIDPRVQEQGEHALLAQIGAIERGAYGPFTPRDTADRLQGAAVALDPRTGAVRAWVGGRAFTDSEFDRVDQAERQVGSLIKPFLVASALERGLGMLAPVSADTVPIQSASGPWLPADHVDETVLPLREALVRSSNRAAAHLAMDLGLDALGAVGRNVGIDSPIPEVPSTSIGAFDASLLDMTGAYAVFGNGGRMVEPHLIERVEDRDGTVLWTRPNPTDGDPALAPTTSFVVLDAMRDVVDRGTAVSVRHEGYRGPAAGKTGTTNNGKDAWFVGLTPGLVSGIWLGFDDPAEIVPDAGGGALAAPAWARWMDALEGTEARSRTTWPRPIGVERVRYDPVTGRAIERGCATRSGTEPEEAWVQAGSVRVEQCRGGVLGWLERAWHAVAPPSVEPIEPSRVPSGGGR